MGAEQTERTPRGRMLTVREVAERLAIARSTAYELIAKGELPAFQWRGPGSALRVSESELDAWIEAAE
jgi:excisionase family DNA binding protein